MNTNSRSPATVDPTCESTSSRSSSRPRRSSSLSLSPFSNASTGPFQNTRPTTAADRRARLSSGGRRSMRAASTPWTVSGMTISSMSSVARHRSAVRTMRPSSIRWRTISSRKNGLPSARSSMASRIEPGSSSTVSRNSMSRAASSCASGSRKIDEKLRLPPPQAACRCASSGLAGHRKSNGPAVLSASSSSRSSRASSAQWMSSTTAIAGRFAARPVKKARHASCVSRRTWRGGRSAKPKCASSSPNVKASAAAARVGSGVAARMSSARRVIFESATSGGSESSTPVSAFRISASGQ